MSTEKATESTVRAGGLELFVRELGSGPPARSVLFVSGLGYASWCWDDAMELLAPRWRVVTIDNRGTGRSSKPPPPYSVEQMADDLAAALDVLDLGSVHVVGNSMGGYIALSLALRHRSRVRSLVLTNTSHGGPGATTLPEATAAAWREASKLDANGFIERTTSLTFAPGWAEKNDVRFRALLERRMLHPTPPECWLAQFRACEAFFSTGVDVAGIGVPALVMHGTDDRIIPYPNGPRLAAALPNARLHTFEGGGHLPFLEEPAEFARLVDAFLSAQSTM